MKKAAVAVLVATSRIFGLIRSMLCASIFGSTGQADVLNYAFSIPNQTRKCIEEGTGNLSVISRACCIGGDVASGNLITAHLLFLLAVAAAGRPLSVLIMRISPFEGSLAAEGADAFLIFLLFLSSYSLASSFAGLLQAEGKAVVSNILPLVQSAASVILLLIFKNRYGILSFALAMLFSSLMFLFSILAYYFLSGKRKRPVFRPEARFMRPYLSNIAVLLLSVLVSFPYFLSSTAYQGSTTYFSNAYMLIILPYGLALPMINSFAFPKMAGRCTEEEKGLVLGRAFYSVMLFMLICSAGFLSFSKEISIFIFAHGRYRMEDALDTAVFLVLMVPGAFFFLLFSFLERLMFLDGKEKRVKYILSLQLASSYVLMFVFLKSQYAGPLIYSFSNLLCFLASAVLLGNKKEAAILAKGFFKAFSIALPVLIFATAYRAAGMNMYDHASGIAAASACAAIFLVPLSISMLIAARIHRNK